MSDRLTPRLGNFAYSPPGRTALLAAALLTLAVIAPAASARSVTLHYFSRQTTSSVVTPQGQPIMGAPAVGDITDNTGIDYVGDHKHHAKKAAASDHLRCTITAFAAGGGAATCDAQIAIGGSMLLANRTGVTFSQSNAPMVVSISGGTGVYRHAHGQITATNFGNNTDFKIKVAY